MQWGSLVVPWRGDGPPPGVEGPPQAAGTSSPAAAETAAARALGSNLALPACGFQLRATEHKMQIGPDSPPPNRQAWRPPFSDAARTLIVFHETEGRKKAVIKSSPSACCPRG